MAPGEGGEVGDTVTAGDWHPPPPSANPKIKEVLTALGVTEFTMSQFLGFLTNKVRRARPPHPATPDQARRPGVGLGFKGTGSIVSPSSRDD